MKKKFSKSPFINNNTTSPMPSFGFGGIGTTGPTHPVPSFQGCERYEYLDGASNKSVLFRTSSGVSYYYDPITPIQSSSGHYSGGDPVLGEFPMTDGDIQEFVNLIKEFRASSEDKTDRRSKGTGVYSFYEANRESREWSFMLRSGSERNKAIGSVISRLRKRSTLL
eukprot:TRINITY_DN1190_c0_g1_i1.p1 TRINITY_DN1190_c0_g1~~TRINITY_DN1190_c0_g1_i1.p1  ORF type:complete len:188 (+),score=29.38 TRINITY_DN1190_c0_g1_i1:66-566(+)